GEGMARGVLIEDAGQPVTRERCRGNPTCHKAEISRPDTAGNFPGISVSEFRQGSGGPEAGFGQRGDFILGRRHSGGPVVEALEKARRLVVNLPEYFTDAV